LVKVRESAAEEWKRAEGKGKVAKVARTSVSGRASDLSECFGHATKPHQYSLQSH
jgi:hypothetical protein